MLEVLASIAVILILAFISFKLIGNIVQKARVVSAKAQIAQLALLLEAVKDDTGYYPAFLQDITMKIPPNLHKEGWKGFYTGRVPLDPWGVPYFYEIPPTTLFGSPPIPREPGTPDTLIVDFESNPGKALLRVENYGVTSCDITLNGVVVIYEHELKKNPIPQIIEKEVFLVEGNNTIARARSKPGEFLLFSISSDKVPSERHFILGSYGKDRTAGGEGFGQDIVWRSDRYPNFQ